MRSRWVRLLFCGVVSLCLTAGKVPTRKASLGRNMVKKYGCDVCHTTDGKACFGGTLKGIFGTRVKLEGGKWIMRDVAYFRTKIMTSAKLPLADGSNVMPIYKGSITPGQLDAIIAFIRNLRRNKPTSRPISRPSSRPVKLPNPRRHR